LEIVPKYSPLTHTHTHRPSIDKKKNNPTAHKSTPTAGSHNHHLVSNVETSAFHILVGQEHLILNDKKSSSHKSPQQDIKASEGPLSIVFVTDSSMCHGLWNLERLYSN
jgi:hypothetical protein